MIVKTDIKEKTNAESLRLTTENFALQLTHPKHSQWRLQSAVTGNDFDDFGAAQILARDLGEKVPNDRMPFSIEPKDGLLLVTDGTERLEINLSPFSISL